MTPSREKWARAFHRQAHSDWQVYQLLQSSGGIPQCHALHYLQMTCEKLAKAYRVRDTEGDVEAMTSSHGGFVKFMRTWLISPQIRASYIGRDAQFREVSREVIALAREVERLAPAVDAETTPANSEYPWADRDGVIAPCDYTFPSVSFLRDPCGRLFLKLIAKAIEDF